MGESNDQCILVKPDEKMLQEIVSYRAAFLAAGDSMDGTGPLRRMEDPEDWLFCCKSGENRETTPPNWVPSEQFVFLRIHDWRVHLLSALFALGAALHAVPLSLA